METIRVARTRKGLTQRELADRVGVSQEQIHRWETGRLTPRLEAATKIADALDVTLDDLTGRTSPPRPARDVQVLVDELQESLQEATMIAHRLRREVGAPETRDESEGLR